MSNKNYHVSYFYSTNDGDAGFGAIRFYRCKVSKYPNGKLMDEWVGAIRERKSYIKEVAILNFNEIGEE